MQLNINFGGNRMMGGPMGGFPGMMPMGMPMGMPMMNGFGGGMPMGQMNPAMAMMAMAMMTMMAQMMGGGMGQSFPMQIGPGNFGMGQQGCGCGYPQQQGFPVDGFLGNNGYYGGPNGCNDNCGNYGNNGNYGNQGGYGNAGAMPGGPAGRIGNIDVERLVQALPPSQRRAAQQNFPVIVSEAQRQGVTNKAQLAYILATAVHESGAGAHMEEFASGAAYEGRRGLGNCQPGDGCRFKGRGYVQITGRRNYQDWSRRLGVDLVGNPRMAENPQIAAQILVGGMREGTFTGRRLDQYINDQHTDFNGARRIVNGNDRSGRIAGIAQRLLSAMS
jgi:predicted chitinase